METLRLLKVETSNAFVNMAVDEAILTARTLEKSPNTLRLYRWNPSAVSIGRNQQIENEVHVGNCKKLGVSLVRRISGGGTVFHDSWGEVTYALTANTSDVYAKDLMDVYSKVYSGLMDALRILGITADFNGGDRKKCPNLTVKGRKISGSAQTRKRDVFLQHGTLLLDIDLEKMFTLIRVPWARTCLEVLKVAESRITSVRNELGHAVTPETAANAITIGFENALKMKAVEGELTSFEQDIARKLFKEKYFTDDWNLHAKSIVF
ncbi:MAG TPA: biotin/lipoate A/B protein ligase family protein [Candidatus Bathyarchaeia archaeon]